MEKALRVGRDRARMLRSVTAAAALVASLHVLAPQLAPRTVTVEDLSAHLGETLSIEVRVADVEPGARFHRVTVYDATGRVTVLVEDDPPPRGAVVRIVGQPAGDDDGVIVWARSISLVDDAPVGRTFDVDVALREAPRLERIPITVVGHWVDGALALGPDEDGLPVDVDDPPPPGQLVAVRGVIRYSASTASYRLDGLDWYPWNPSPSSASH